VKEVIQSSIGAVLAELLSVVVSQAILAALFTRERTGKGQEIQASILGAALYLAYCNFLNALWLNQDAPRH
jgi:crotonobetainyl-CoA:carnitine CoA-transferase CaiB-like acyl-CoA transferase